MRWFWETAIEPLLEAVGARTIVEVGVSKGHTTAKLVAYAERHDGIVHGIDPAPGAGAIELDGNHDRLVLHVEQSLTALPRIDGIDAALLDGDHNWYTVINELRLLARLSAEQGRELPLVVLHEVDWPYGRRDQYSDPDAIPAEDRQPVVNAGLWPGSDQVFKTRGIDIGAHIAATEGGPRNGVRTAVEDFIAELAEPLEFRSLAGFQGLGILASEARLAANERLRRCLDTFESPAWLAAHTRVLEQQRLFMKARFASRRHRSEAMRPRDAQPVEATRARSPHSYGAAPELTVVIPTLDVLSERVRRCVEAIRSHTDVDYEIVLADNSAPPQGFTAPANAGIRAARGAYVVVMNDDVEVLPGWWPPLRHALEQGAYASFPITQDGFHRHDFTGWCFAVSRETIARIGHTQEEFFDPQFRVFCQDTDLLLRLRQAGHPPVPVDASQITHHLSRTLRSRADKELADWIEQQIEEDRKAFERKWPQ
jgi:hypothetical protein